MSGLPSFAPLNSDPAILFKSWQTRYPNSSTNLAWRKNWQAIPKFVWWKIWLARNDLIFNSKKSKPANVALKAKDFLLEVVGSPQLEEIKLEVEHNWLRVRQENKAQLGASKPVIKPHWQIKMTEKEILEWWHLKNKVTIFFDGVSKGNPWKAGAGGLIYYPGGMLATSFSWGVGQLSNNQAELYALLKSCQLAKAASQQHSNFWRF